MSIVKNKEKPVQRYRFYIQVLFAVITIWIGIEFYLFVSYLNSGGASAFYERPPGAEGFLPISALMSVYYFLQTGIIHQSHPAGFFIFIGVIAISIFAGKSFCSWVCPVGFISETVGEFGDKILNKIFKRKLKLPRLLDSMLRSLKYIILGFFVYIIFFSMSEAALKVFLDSPYNKISDVKMYYFFAHISQFSLIVIGVLFFLSIVIRNFWCRYLCPYGALLGIISFLSPNKIKRNTDTCIDCGLCNKVCASSIKVDKVKTVYSDECTSCFNCVDACPVADTLTVQSALTKKKVDKKYIAFGIVAIYFIIISLGMLTGNWKGNTSREEYLINYQSIESIGHPRSAEEIQKLNQLSKDKMSDKKD